jgi:Pregnancy-associated plasma protein-A
MPRTCATMTLHHALANTSEMYQINRRQIEAFTTTLRRARAARRAQVVRVPVVVHVLHHGNAENISDAQIRSQIDALNHDYRRLNADVTKVPTPFGPLAADSMIEFGLAVKDPQGYATSGITRTYTPLAVFRPDTSDPERQILELDAKIKTVAGGGATGWPRDRYLNIWVCNMDQNPLGYAQFPGGPSETDGVVIDVKCFGVGGSAEPPFDLGRTATHQVGHWLNLLHIWGDDDQGCSGSDSVEDTPNQAGANVGVPTFPRISCGNAPHGDMFMNFMDYTDDSGMQMFTVGQVERMNATLHGPRSSVVASDALTPSHRIAQVHLPEFSAFLAGPPVSAREEGELAKRVFDGVHWV